MKEIEKSNQSVSPEEVSRVELLGRLISGEKNINDCLSKGIPIKWDEMIKMADGENIKKEEVLGVFVDWAVNNEFNLKSYMDIFSPSDNSKTYGVYSVIGQFYELRKLVNTNGKFNPVLLNLHEISKELKKYTRDFKRSDFLGMKIGNDIENLKVITNSVIDEALKNIKENEGYICAKTVNQEIEKLLKKPTPAPPLT